MGSKIRLFNTVSNCKLSKAEIGENFGDLHPNFTPAQAGVESAECLYCYDAPCLNACPTRIDIPKFIRQINTGDSDGAAKTILSENILGGTCARACPTEILCEQACVVNQTKGAPVKIGQLQRHAVEGLMAKQGAHPFQRAAETGKTFAVIGAGPAGLAFAHRISMLGHKAVIFDKQERPGGLNEYGLAEYKMADDFAQREVAFLLEIGGIEIRTGLALGEDLDLETLRTEYAGVFIGVGLGKVPKLSVPGVELEGVDDAVDFIAGLRQAADKSTVPVGRNVIVIGGGNTAIDAAVQARCLGAENVTIVYRRGADAMSATDFEQQLATTNGIRIIYWAAPKSIEGEASAERIVLDRTAYVDGSLATTGETVTLDADMILLAIGQSLAGGGLEGLELKGGKIVVDDEYQTSLAGVYAGGDCIASGTDLTVQAVEDGKQAAMRADAHMKIPADTAIPN